MPCLVMGCLSEMGTGGMNERSLLYDRIHIYCTETDGGRGIWKRIDENRELLELIQKEAPKLLEQFPFIEVWLGNQDIFLMNLLQLMELPLKPEWTGHREFPRRWPGNPCIEGAYMEFSPELSKKLSLKRIVTSI